MAHAALRAGAFSLPATDAKIPLTPAGWAGFWQQLIKMIRFHMVSKGFTWI